MKTLIITNKNSITKSNLTDLQIAFETRNKATWNLPIEKYGYGCKNIDEVLTHIRFGQMTECNPPIFTIK